MFRDTEKLIERCIRREEKAWEEFIERFSGLLYYSAQERLRRSGFSFGHEDLEDIVQGIFVELWEKDKLKEVRDRKKIKAWLSIVAQTRALNSMRAKRERLLREDEGYRIDRIPQQFTGVFVKDLETSLEEVIRPFQPKQRLVLKLHLIYKKKHREIANILNVPVNTVSSILARKKKILRKKMKEN